MIQKVCEEYQQSLSIRPGHYQKITFDASYLLALIDRFIHQPKLLADQPVTGSQIAEMPVAEGRELLRLHRLRERNRGLVARKKRQALSDTKRLECEACRFDFAVEYGPLGEGFAECHHRLPFAAAAGERRTRLADLAIVCANCHRMLHRRPWRTVEQLRELVRARRSER